MYKSNQGSFKIDSFVHNIVLNTRGGEGGWRQFNMDNNGAQTKSSSWRYPTATHSSSSMYRYNKDISLLLPSFPQITSMILFSFIVSEVLNYCGLFQDENGHKAKEEASHFFNQHETIESAFFDVLGCTFDKIENFWNEKKVVIEKCKQKLLHVMDRFDSSQWDNINYRIRWTKLSFKHQFAIGSSIGMILHRLSFEIVKLSVIIYVSSEILENIQENIQRDNNNNNKRYNPSRNGVKYNHNFNEKDYDSDDNVDHGFSGEFDDAESALNTLCETIKASSNIFLHSLDFITEKLRWLRCGIRSILESPERILGKIFDGSWMDQEGTLFVGFLFGTFLGYLISS